MAIGKKELAAALNWSRPKLDRRLKEDAKFPVLSRGDQAGGWSFELTAVRTYLDGAPPVDIKQLADAMKPLARRQAIPTPRRQAGRRSADHHGEATARQRKDEADASLKEDKLKLQRGELLERGSLRQHLAQLFAQLASDLDALPEEIAKRLELPTAAPQIRTLIDKARAEMVASAEPLLADDPPDAMS